MLRGEDIRHLAAIVALPLVLVLAAASPAGGSTGSNDRAEGALYSIRIEGASVDRPVLDRLVRTADIRGITLAEAIDRHVGDLGVSELEPGGTSREATTLPEIMIDDIHLAELEDMKLIAERDGLSLVEAIDSHAWQSRFLELADTVESSYPDQFSGAGIGSSSAGRSAWFGFKDGIPAEVAGVVGSLPTTVELVGGKGFSETELVETLHVAHDQIYARQDVVNVHGSYDIRSGTITIQAQPDEAVLASKGREQLRAELQPAQPRNSSMKIRLEVVDELESTYDDGYVRGGGLLNTSGCTAGFTIVHRVTGNWGISTARHCADRYTSQVYANHSSDGGSTRVAGRVRGSTNYGDVAYYNDGSYTATRTFYNDWNDKRFASAVWSPRTGVDVCRFGRTTGVQCDETYRTNVTRAEYKGLVATHRRNADDGDSGGPWYWGQTAYGIHSGGKRINLILRDVFTPASSLPSAMNVEVRTS